MTAISGPGVPVTHEPEPDMTTAYTIGGPRDGKLLDLRFRDARLWPASAHCSCGMMLSRASREEPWVHTGRMPGDSI